MQTALQLLNVLLPLGYLLAALAYLVVFHGITGMGEGLGDPPHRVGGRGPLRIPGACDP